MKNALILHGTNGNSQGNWFPWLKIELEKKGWKVWVPDLPRANQPNPATYKQYLLSNTDFELNDQTVLIGHSSGAVAILAILQQLPSDVVVNTCILVGAFKDTLHRTDLNDLFNVPFDFEKIKQHAKHFIFIHSDNDPYCPLEHAEYLAKHLDANLIVRKGQGHFNLETSESYRQFPFLLSLLP